MFFIDIETVPRKDLKSHVNLKETGIHRYARDYDPLILVFSYNGKMNTVLNPLYTSRGGYEKNPVISSTLRKLLTNSNYTAVAHNAEFERVVLTEWGKRIGVDVKCKWLCTAEMCRRACIPASLDSATKVLGCEAEKDPKGVALMKKFSIPDDTGRVKDPDKYPEDFEAYIQYCVRDVEAEIDLYNRLHKNFSEHPAMPSWVTRNMNDVGIGVDMASVKLCQEVVADVTNQSAKKFIELTGLEHTRVKAIGEWVRSQGVPCTSLSSDTIEKTIHEAESRGKEKVAEALRVRRMIAFSAFNKLPAIVRSAVDGKVKGSLVYHGASTGRWTSQLVQTQNLKRSTKASMEFYELIREGTPVDIMRLHHGGDLEDAACAVRHFFVPDKGKWVQADYSAIEARIVAWVSGCESMLEEFRGEGKVYELMASIIYGIDKASVGKKSAERQLGKQAILGLGYGMQAPQFRDTCLGYGINVSTELAEKAVEQYRKGFPEVPKMWNKLQKESTYCAKTGRPIGNWRSMRIGDNRWLMYKLPSGRELAYFNPVYDKNGGFGKGSWTYERPTKAKGKPMSPRNAWRGALMENVCQAIAGDIMCNGVINVINAGHKVAMLVHDEAVCYEDGGLTPDKLVKLMCDTPKWAKGLPIEAEGEYMEYYRK